MSTINPAAVAGMFYPDSAEALRMQVDAYLAQARGEHRPPKALIAPHAGYRYSGQVAADAYAALEPVASRIRRVILLGPAHRVRLKGIAASSADYFNTPLGNISLDREAIQAALALPQVGIADVAFDQEHSLEVHLPFLQRVLHQRPFKLAPFVVGEASPEQVAALLDRLWGGDETLIVISSDLSHFHDYETARALDGTTSRHILRFETDAIGYENACGRNPVNGLLHTAKKRGMTPELVSQCNSGDTAGDKQRVVGYGAYLFHGGEHAH